MVLSHRSQEVVTALRQVERQQEAFGYASETAWARLEGALSQLNGHELPPSLTQRLERAFQD